MKFKFTSKSKVQAEEFKKHLKADRNIEASISEKDGKFYVDYSVAEVDTAAMKDKKNAKKAAKKGKPDPKNDPDKDGDDDSKDPNDKKDKPQKSKADMITPDCGEDDYVQMDDMQDMFSSFATYIFNEMQYQMNWMSSQIDSIANAFYQHTSNGHLPPINGADKMNGALKALGIAGDYQVQKPIVYASTSKTKVPTMDLDFPEPKKK